MTGVMEYVLVTPPHKLFFSPAMLPGVAGAEIDVNTSVLDVANAHELDTTQA